ncbi:MAG TPA: Glu/Leu/Phe/Val dehydrogenase dimerization domain-containing protein [Pseudonocardiaceae bacterium]|jgi:glutamate dehydrogenase (NAD(P)+)|nr:Glu/Leu/Phe/Val dehydrogenase dimerization domain-containing protein [Pseudonocardiaceae bacterium]
MTETIDFRDPRTGTHGWLVYDGDGRSRPLAAGGCRVQAGLDAGQLATLAERMTLKQRVLGLNVDGAKCGIDLDPRSPHKAAALGSFLAFLRHELRTRFSMGSDMGTDWQELLDHGARAGVPSVKYAIRSAQGLSDDEFFVRMGVLNERVGHLKLSQLRAGHALGHAAIAAARAAGSTGRPTVAMQGFGNLGRGAAHALLRDGARLVAVADADGTVVDARGLDVDAMLRRPLRTPVPAMAGRSMPTRRSLFGVPADVLVLAAGADALDTDHAATVPVGAVAVGANCGLSEQVEGALHRRGVFVVPDFIGGIGGSASMEALFGPAVPPEPEQLLRTLSDLMRDLVGDIAAATRETGTSPRNAALRLAEHTDTDPAARPYGNCRYLTVHSA